MSFTDWKFIDEAEKLNGYMKRKTKEKIVSFDEMLEIIKQDPLRTQKFHSNLK